LALKDSDYSQSISLNCIVCASEDMSDPQGDDDPNRPIECNAYKSKFTYQELLDGNSEKISNVVEDVKKNIVKDIRKEFNRIFK
jgi:hypothetical protein